MQSLTCRAVIIVMKYLKYTVLAMVTLLLISVLPSCNNDIFVDDFKPDVEQLSLSGEGDAYTVHFKSADWDMLDMGLPYDENLVRTVTPLGGEPYEGYILKGDGCISAANGGTDIVVTRSGSEMKVEVRYAIGTTPLRIWLTATNSVTNDVHSMEVVVDRVGGYEILDVDYNLDTWGSSVDLEPVQLDNISLVSSTSGAVKWFPKLSAGGLVSGYVMGTSSADEPVLRSLCGEKVPVPTRTSPGWSDWALRGEEAAITMDRSSVILEHYPPYPSPIEVRPGTRTALWAEMEECYFDVTLTVRNIFSGEVSDIWRVLSIFQPEKYVVTHDEI